MLSLAISIEVFFYSPNFYTKDNLTQTNSEFKYIFILSKVAIAIISIFLPTMFGDILIIIMAFIMVFSHYYYMPFKNFDTTCSTGGILLWYFFHTVLVFIYNDLNIFKTSFNVDISLMQLFLFMLSLR